MRFFVYKLVADNGGAPCAVENLLSLAICKPMIRQSAAVGDWIFGFGAQRLGERLIYIARVTEKLARGDYYRDDVPLRRGRPDRIYRWTGGSLVLRPEAAFHADRDHRERDVGHGPLYERAAVLISDDFRYLGDAGTTEYKLTFPQLAGLVGSLKQGHRVNHDPAPSRELKRLQQAVWEQFPSQMVIGHPCDAPPDMPSPRTTCSPPPRARPIPTSPTCR